MQPLTVTLAEIRKYSPCAIGWEKLLKHLSKTRADDEPLLLETVLDSNGLDDALWCLRSLGPTHQQACRLYAVWCVRRVQHLMADGRSILALDVAERHANGCATDMELTAARDAAWDAAWGAAMDDAAGAAGAARDAKDAQTVRFRQMCRDGQWIGGTK
jgi:hypothetical protein